MQKKIDLANRIAKLRQRGASVEGRLDVVGKEAPTASDCHVPVPMGGEKKIKKEDDEATDDVNKSAGRKRIPGDGDGDGIPYESRSKKPKPGTVGAARQSARVNSDAGLLRQHVVERFGEKLASGGLGLQDHMDFTSKLKRIAHLSGHDYNTVLTNVMRDVSAKHSEISPAERAAGHKFAAKNTHSGAKGMDSLAQRLSSSNAGHTYGSVKEELDTISGLVGSHAAAKDYSERVRTASQVARTHSAMRENHMFTQGQRNDIADALRGRAAYDSNGDLVRRK